MALNIDLWLQIFYGLVGSGAAGFFTFRLVKMIFPDAELLAAQQRLGVESAARKYRHKVLEIISPFVRLILPRIQQVKMPIYRQRKQLDFVAAGVADQFDPDEFVGLKIVSGFVTIAFAGLFALQLGYSLSFELVLISLVVGFFLPDFVVWDIKRTRQKEILKTLPTFIDLLTLSVEAGLDFMAAISRVANFAKPGPLKEEFNQMLKELQVGVIRADALRNMADRVQLTELSSFATVLIQADQMGGGIGPALRAQSDLLRNARFQRAEREGTKATQKLLIPLIIFILPAVFIVILGPMICDIVYNQTWFKDIFGGGGAP